MTLASKATDVKYITLLMIAVGIFFAIPGILYIQEGGPMIALLPLFLSGTSFAAAYGLYILKKMAWFVTLLIGFTGLIIYIADFANANIESYIGFVLCIMLLCYLIFVRKLYL